MKFDTKVSCQNCLGSCSIRLPYRGCHVFSASGPSPSESMKLSLSRSLLILIFFRVPYLRPLFSVSFLMILNQHRIVFSFTDGTTIVVFPTQTLVKPRPTSNITLLFSVHRLRTIWDESVPGAFHIFKKATLRFTQPFVPLLIRVTSPFTLFSHTLRVLQSASISPVSFSL